MKKAFGLLELLIVLLVVICLYFLYFRDVKFDALFNGKIRVNQQKQLVDDKIKDIENTKIIKDRIENKLQEGY